VKFEEYFEHGHQNTNK